jgi:hypothetical protein
MPEVKRNRPAEMLALFRRLATKLRAWALPSYFVILAAFLSLCYFVFGTYGLWPYRIESDGKYYYQYLVSGYYDRDFDFTNNYQAPRYEWMHLAIDHYNFLEQRGPVTGRPTNLFTIGPAILWLPFFLLGQLVAVSLNAVGAHIDINPWGLFFQYTVMYSAVVYTLLTLYLLFHLLRSHFADRIAVYATWVLLFATNLFYYTIFEPSMSHVYDLCTYVVFLFLYLIGLRSPRLNIYFGLALAGALHVLVRTQNMATIVLFSIALVVSRLLSHQGLPSARIVATYGVTLLLGLLPIPLLNEYLYGHPFVIPQGTDFLHWSDPRILEVLFSGRNGLFSHHPALLLGLIGFVLFLYWIIKTRDRTQAIFFCAMFAAFMFQLYINSSVADWWGGNSFGQRRLISSFPLFAFGLAFLIQRLHASHPRLNAWAIVVSTVTGLYLTYIHVFP